MGWSTRKGASHASTADIQNAVNKSGKPVTALRIFPDRGAFDLEMYFVVIKLLVIPEGVDLLG